VRFLIRLFIYAIRNEGKETGRLLTRLFPLVAALLIVGGAYNMLVYHGLSDAQSMDNAQLARQLARGQGFTTEFLRPQAIAQLHDFATSKSLRGGSADLFPADRFPPGTPRILPDTYNPPGYPLLLSIWFRLIHPEFGQVPTAMSASHIYSPDRWIPFLNQAFMLLTAVLVFALGQRLFDERVAWMSLVAFLGTDLIWHFTLTALSTSILMFLVTAALMCALEIFCVSEACFENEDRSFLPAFGWALATSLFLAAASLTRFNMLVLLIPLFVVLITMPRASFFSFALIAVITIAAVAPWFYHLYRVSGNPLGSNFALVLYGQGEYAGNQIYCSSSIPEYEHLFKDSVSKELTGFRWHLEHAWDLLGANPLILLFAASILHQFKRRRTRIFQWLLYGSALFLVLANNLGSAKPEDVDPWNIVIVLYPCMLVIGAAFFFILLDRINIQVGLLHGLIVISTVAFILAPMALTLTGDTNQFYAFPPYYPPAIKGLAQCAQPDEWVTTDMPWATAWYADRPSLWLPDSMADFENLNTNVCPTGILLLTPVSWSQPFATFTTGEYKDWGPLVSTAFNPEAQPPSNFPLSVHSQTPGIPYYSIWSDRPRWQTR
jgi:4-amino-4-deoxy-L-arabinose transferase-like glycosyltransferase